MVFLTQECAPELSQYNESVNAGNALTISTNNKFGVHDFYIITCTTQVFQRNLVWCLSMKTKQNLHRRILLWDMHEDLATV